jgi:hypothetical protein
MGKGQRDSSETLNAQSSMLNVQGGDKWQRAKEFCNMLAVGRIVKLATS